MSRAPHLVLDGAALAAEIVGAARSSSASRAVRPRRPMLERAIEERRGDGYDAVPVRLVAGPHRYVSGEETAIVNWLNGGDAKPTSRRPARSNGASTAGRRWSRTSRRWATSRLIGRFGADWFRSAGTADDPGTTLVTMSGGVERPGVYEIPLGARLSDVVDWPACTARASRRSSSAATSARGSPRSARRRPAGRRRAAAGGRRPRRGRRARDAAGRVCAASPRARGSPAGSPTRTRDSAGRASTGSTRSRARWQCSSPVIASNAAEAHLTRWLAQMQGRGACKHPDGVARFVASSLRVFADEIARRRHGPVPRERARADADAGHRRMAMSSRLVREPDHVCRSRDVRRACSPSGSRSTTGAIRSSTRRRSRRTSKTTRAARSRPARRSPSGSSRKQTPAPVDGSRGSFGRCPVTTSTTSRSAGCKPPTPTR